MNSGTSHYNIALLFGCEALTRTANIILLTTMALTGKSLAASAWLATLPLALVPVSTMCTTIPAARMMQRWGRKAGFALGTGVGALGALVCFFAVMAGNYWGLCFGALGLGVANGFATYYRFAAAEAADDAFRSRAISLVMGGGIAAALVGSQLAAWGKNAIASQVFAGSFACVAGVYIAAFCVVQFSRLPRPQGEEARMGGRSLSELARQPRFIAAVVGAMASWGIMSLLMNATPLSMARHDHPFADTTWVIQWHVLGMYIPAFFTGHLIRRFGEMPIMLAGLGLNMLAALSNLSGVELNHYLVGLTLLGVGWNFLFVGATSLLTHTYADNERARVQAANDFAIFAVMVLATYSAGPIEGSVGWFGLNQVALPLIAVVSVVIAWLGTRKPIEASVPVRS